MSAIRAISVGDTVQVRSPSAGRWTGEVVSWVSSAGETNQARVRCHTPPAGTGHGIRAGQTTVVPVATLLPLTPPDQISIGDTVEVRTTGSRGRWRGEVLEFIGDLARVMCIDPRAHHGMSEGLVLSVPEAQLVRAGDPDGMRADGCDDVNVTGRVRPYHRHAVSGRAHAHPNGGEPHTHTELGRWQQEAAAVLAALPEKVALDALVAEAVSAGPPDPVEVVAWIVRDHFKLDRSGPPDDDDRAVARRVLAALVSGPWHLVTLVDGASGDTDVMWQP